VRSSSIGPVLDSDAQEDPQRGRPPEEFQPSSDETEGILNPTLVEQIGYMTTHNVSVRTDVDPIPSYEFDIDEEHAWVASEAEVSIWNLTTLYLVNGTFEAGTLGANMYPNGTLGNYPSGWSAISTNTAPLPADQVQYANYEESYDGRRYVMVENQGDRNHPLKDLFLHHAGTTVLWNQTLEITPYTEEFVLDFDYLFLRGPLGTGFIGNCSITVYVDGYRVWNVSLPTIAKRGVWYNTGSIPVNLSVSNNPTNLTIGLVVDETLDLDGEQDYDNDGFADGEINTRYITVYLDDVSFTGANAPSCAEVDFAFTAGGQTTPLTGSSGFGSATIVNESYWRADLLKTMISSNTSVSFVHETRVRSHRFINSTSTTHETEPGVAFTVLHGTNPDLSFYAYLGFLGDYADTSMRFWYPSDWYSVTVYDPLLTDVSSQCIVSSGSVEVPGVLMERLGWWRVDIKSPNYAQSIDSLILDRISSSWMNRTTFRSTNVTKASVQIGGAISYTGLLDRVNVTWIMPNGTTWFFESLNGGYDGAINGSSLEFGSVNTTAGVWNVEVYWSNGTEIAYDLAVFEVHHRTSLIPVADYDLIEAESGETVWSYLQYRDAENGEYLMEPISTIIANWSGSNVYFTPNPAQKWWEVSLDTSVLGPGDSLVVVNASRQYFDEASCVFTVRLVFADNILSLYETVYELGLGEPYLAKLRFTDRYGSGIENANVSVRYTGPAGGLSYEDAVYLGSGNYSIELTARYSGSYTITFSAFTDYYRVDEDTLFLNVGSLASELVMMNGSAAIVEYGRGFRLVVRYTNWTGDGLPGAHVVIASRTPEDGIDAPTSQYEGDGYYSLVLTPQVTDTYTILIRANATNYVTQLASFTLHVTEISTNLDTISLVEALYYGRSYKFTFGYRISNGTGIPGATPSATGIGSEWISFVELGNGIYNISIVPEQLGSYTVYITMQKEGFQTGTATFTFQTARVPVRVEMQQPVWVQFLPLDLSVSIVEADTGNPVPNATVWYELQRGLETHSSSNMTETSTGVFVITVADTWGQNERYTVRISVQHDYYELPHVFERQVSLVPNEAAWFGFYLTRYGPYMAAAVGLLVVGAVGQKRRARRKREYLQRALEIKRRYDDANNLIGIVILHKTSGLPVYSNILKGGFEEGMISAFITAITHFRAEIFADGEDDITYEAIPISDIIRAVPTKNLVCAFITVTSATAQQEERMIDFARGVGGMLDHEMSRKPTQASDAILVQVLESLFYERLDGFLLQYYKKGISTEFPRRYRPVEDALAITEAADCARPMYMAKSIALNKGVSEAEACFLVFEAIEKDFMVQCDQREITSFTRMNWELPRDS